MPFTEERLREIAAEAARSLYPPESIGDITVSLGANFHGEEAYFFEIYLDQDDNRDEAADLRLELCRELRDRLTAEGDDRFPYARILRLEPPLPDPTKLLDVSRHLAIVGTSEALRRAISTIYYALFHCLVQDFAALDEAERTEMLALMIAGARA